MGSLAGAAQLLNDNAVALRYIQSKQKLLVACKDKDVFDLLGYGLTKRENGA